ncbi:hypothetical protein N0V93_006053 [Gnomoniopsis smithogilvyi]|uniref:Protection of telomeres protein 1 n=1 Tax=Gnomoniopsis smithogilvyi TaxID=1191159 RepID=A0A9W9CV89_9PEZI|nr:hypothetical protein N0V93_006053 [Gnomoniopsis smithogilvyi]
MARFQPANSGQRRAQDNPRFPKSWTTIRDLLDGTVPSGKYVSIVGVVKDYRLPLPTKGTDYKCTLTLCDTSTEYDNEDININIFRSETEMPKVEAGDIVIVSMAKFQVYNGTASLLTSYNTDVFVYEARRLPACKRSGSARGALKPPTRQPKREPDATENEYVLWLFGRIDQSIVPDQHDFSARARQSLNVKDKFCLLQDVRDSKFADLIVQVVKEPYDLGDKMTLWVSDYTENNSFFLQTRDSVDWADGVPTRDGDVYGYTNNRKKPMASLDEENRKWSGPEGKRSLQLTCWEPHASFIRQNVHQGDWVRLRNVQIRYGHNSVNIEGCLREDLKYRDRVYVEIMDPTGDRETLDQRLVDAILRKRTYEKAQKQAHKNGEKRKAQENPQKENRRAKRQKQRENKQKAIEEEAAKQQAALGFNNLIVSEHQDKDIIPLSTILQPVYYTTSIDNQEVKLELPFTCAMYRTNVRVVDFHPACLKDFAVGRAPTEYDYLLNNDDDSESDAAAPAASASSSPPASSPSHHHHDARRLVWQWRFALKLEEASSTKRTKTTPAQAWVVVDNPAAQLLLDLDATDLHASACADELATLRERLFKLWGNLEERKTRLEAKKLQHARDPLHAPPAGSSDDEDDSAGAHGGGDVADADVPGSQLSNRPFTCCIRQYGVPILAEEGGVDDLGQGKKWHRMFGLFGTKIRDV